MAYRVTAGRVSAETKVNEKGGRATVDFHRGAVLPDDVPDEHLQSLLRLGHVEDAEAESTVDDSEPDEELDLEEHVPLDEGEKQPDLSAMDKDELLAYADEHEIAVDKRLGVDNLRAAIEAAE